MKPPRQGFTRPFSKVFSAKVETQKVTKMEKNMVMMTSLQIKEELP